MFHTFIHCNDYMYRIGPRPLIQSRNLFNKKEKNQNLFNKFRYCL